jgi:uncharacterized membrane protein YqaE (UPF0057 family)
MGLGKLVEAIEGIAELFVNLGKLIEIIITFLFEMLPNIIQILNPVNILNDIISGITLSIKIVFKTVMDMFTTQPQVEYNKCKDNGEGVCGYRKIRNTNGKILPAKESENAEKQGKKCMQPTLFRLIMTVICPPLGLLLHSGPRAWFHIIIASLLTVYCFYFPGLIYVVMHTLC